MLLAFSVENFKSIRDLQTLSMEAGGDGHLEITNVFEAGRKRILKSAAVFGPNASGKSNVLDAMKWMNLFVQNSSKDTQVGEIIPVEPFVLSTLTESAPTHFEIEFLLEEQAFRYGFTATTQRVESEWLFRKSPTAKPTKLFTREGQKFSFTTANFREGKDLERRTRENALFLSVCSQWNGPVATKVMAWFKQFRHISGISDDAYFAFTAERLQSPQHRKGLLGMAQQADFSIQSLRSELEESQEPQGPLGRSNTNDEGTKASKVTLARIKTTHAKRDGSDKDVGKVEFDLQEESKGTEKFIALSGPLTYTLETGSILVIDELEASLHRRLTQAIVDLFHSPLNQKNAQLICATHDVTLLEPDRFRRDQIWFCEKSEAGATDLYQLADFDSSQVRANSKFSRQYLLGLFGAVPQLAHFEEAVKNALR